MYIEILKDIWSIIIRMSKRENLIPIKRDADQHYRYKMPQLQCKQLSAGNGIKTSIFNARSIANAIGRTTASLTQWYSYSLAVQAKQVQNGTQIYLNGDHQSKALIDKLYEFIDTFVLCPVCSNPETTYVHRGNSLYLHCTSCGNTSQVNPNKGAYFTKMRDWINIHFSTEGSNASIATQSTQIVPKSTKVEDHQQTSDMRGEIPEEGVYINTEELDKISSKLEGKVNEPSKKDQDDFFDSIQKMAAEDSSKVSDEEIFNEVQKYQKKWNAKDAWMILVVFHALFEDNPTDMLNVIKKRRKFLILFLMNENDQKGFLSVLVQFITKTHPELLSSAPIIFYTLYDNEIIDDAGLKLWLKKPSKSMEGGVKASDYLRNVILKDFIKWVDESPYEQTPPEEEEEENDKAPSDANEKTEKTEKESIDDIDIDSI